MHTRSCVLSCSLPDKRMKPELELKLKCKKESEIRNSIPRRLMKPVENLYLSQRTRKRNEYHTQKAFKTNQKTF